MDQPVDRGDSVWCHRHRPSAPPEDDDLAVAGTSRDSYPSCSFADTAAITIRMDGEEDDDGDEEDEADEEVEKVQTASTRSASSSRPVTPEPPVIVNVLPATNVVAQERPDTPRPEIPDDDLEPTWRYTMPSSNGTNSANALTTGVSSGTSSSAGGDLSPGTPTNPLGQWPHSLSPVLATVATTLGLFNLSRFAILAIHYGANFLLQFVVMSLVLGIPLLTYHLSLGQLLASGSIDMWRISPVMQGIGISLIASQAMIGVYSVVGVSWLFAYFRDSFIARDDLYRWAQPVDPSNIGLLGSNGSGKLEETVGDYFTAVVLQRSASVDGPLVMPHSALHSAPPPSSAGSGLGGASVISPPAQLRFQLVCNLAIIWIIVFIVLSKGLKSYGKVVLVFSAAPIFGLAILSSKLFGITPPGAASALGPIGTIDWTDFFLNTRSWSAALVESFMTWGLLGAAAKQTAAMGCGKRSPPPALHRTAAAIALFTFTVLAITAFIANSCVVLLATTGYTYGPSSFERASGVHEFLQRVGSRHGPSSYSSLRWVPHAGLLLGERVSTPAGLHSSSSYSSQPPSGYSALRLATELMPSTLAALGTHLLSPFWAVLFYLVLILFGISQQLAIMHCVISGIVSVNAKSLKQWETTITFFTCACGFVLGLPMATELGMFVVYFLDYAVGGAWWIAALYLAELAAVFVVRGRPYSGETVVARLFARAAKPLKQWFAPVLSFIWNVILPVILTILCISMFKGGSWREVGGGNSMGRNRGSWAGAGGAGGYWPSWARHVAMTLQLGPLVVIPIVTAIIQTFRYLSNGPPDIFDRFQLLYRPSMNLNSSNRGGGSTDSSSQSVEETPSQPPPIPPMTPPLEDPPPKYTPPPSYSTATGARIAKLLRQSFRRSMRRLRGVTGSSTESPSVPPPPYTTVLVEMGGSGRDTASGGTAVSTVAVGATSGSSTAGSALSTMLRNSFRCAMRQPVTESSSSQRLVDAAAPINQDSFILQASGDPIEQTPAAKSHNIDENP